LATSSEILFIEKILMEKTACVWRRAKELRAQWKNKTTLIGRRVDTGRFSE